MTKSAAVELLAANPRLDALDRADSAWLTDAMAIVYAALADTPDRLLQEFESFSEALLADENGERAQAVAAGAATIANGGKATETLLDAARLLRALEMTAVECTRYTESDRGADLESAWRTRDGQHYVIPRLTSLRAIDGKPFLRRALLHYRILPTEIDGFNVRLHRINMVLAGAARDREASRTTENYGAALFPGLKVRSTFPNEHEFLVDGLSGFGAEAELRDHISRSRANSCLAIVWAELTMPESSIDLLRAILAEGALDGEPRFRFLVAGSWHREAEGGMRNIGRVLDGAGETLFEVTKWAKFKLGDKREAIVPGDEIHVLISEDSVAVFAICRDFLQETKEVPYRRLNVDVAFVPSMTASIDDPATLQGHAVTAHTMRVRFGTRTLVVAQPAVPPKTGVGRVLAFPAKPLAGAQGEVVKKAWHLCVLEPS